jgi:hypothetical protein
MYWPFSASGGCVTLTPLIDRCREAVETHNTNHPEVDHDCANRSQVDPRRYPRTDRHEQARVVVS